MLVTLTARMHGVLRYSNKDAVLVLLSLMYAALLVTVPSTILIALGLWWTANTVAHNFIHTPFFRPRALNGVYSIYLSALMGFPQELWRQRHLRHHRGDERSMTMTTRTVIELVAVVAAWGTIAITQPSLFATVYVPGYIIGMALCSLQ